MKKYIIILFLIFSINGYADNANDYYELAQHSYQKGDFSKALEYQKQSLLTSKKNFGAKSEQTATMQNFLGLIYYAKGDLKKALEYQTKALSLRQKILDKEHPDMAESYTVLGMTYQMTGEYQKSFEYRKQSLEINRKVYGDKHIKTASSYNYVGVIYNILGDSKKALEYLERGLSIKKKIYSDENIDIAESYKYIGLTYYTLGKYLKSLEYLNKALNLGKKILGEKHYNISEIHTYLGVTYQAMGDLPKALEHYKKTLVINKTIFGTNHANTATSYTQIGTIYVSIGDYSKALNYHNKALDINKKVFPKTHPTIALSYGSIGIIYQTQKEYKKALVYFKEALSIFTKQIDKEHHFTTIYYNLIGSTYSSMKNYPEALKYLKKSIEIQERTIGRNHPNLATSYGEIGSVYSSMGNYVNALEYFNKALTIREKILNRNHSSFIPSYHNISIVYSKIGNYLESYHYAKKSFNIFIKNRDRNFFILDNKQKTNYQKIINPIKMFFYSAFLYQKSLKDPKEQRKINQYMLNSWINYKRTVFDIENSLKILYAQTKNKTIKSNIDELNIRKRQLARLYQNIPQDATKLKLYNQNIQKIEDRISELEIYLGSKSSKIYLKDIKYQDISKILKPKELYIDFVKLKDGYCYFILDKAQNIKFELLGEIQTKNIDSTIEEIQNETEKIINYTTKKIDIEESKKQYTKLYSLIFKDIDVKDKNSLIISPDGLLGLIPFEAFYDDKEKKYLIEKLNIRYIPSGKELVKLYQNRTKSNEDITVFANPNFGFTKKQTKESNNEFRRGTIDALYSQANREGRTNGFFSFLNGSVDEADSISTIFRDNDPEIYMRDRANEENLLNIKAPKILHLSTHGFFIKDKDILNPMLKSGIALSGANHAIATKTGNGIVTGFELSGINLNGTELVVLSACETGVGDVEEAEGVAGLSKAFMKAGAKHIVMSLWSVDDKATATLMEKFYENIKKGKSYSVALREAKLFMIKNVKSHPFYWSGFVGSGKD